MPNFVNLSPFTEDGDVHVVVGTPRGNRAKFGCDPKLETFALTKSLLNRADLSPRLGICAINHGR
jgi:inorganic pyrophosphatase